MGVKVLVVDDEKLIRWSLSQALERAGHEVVAASSGEEAVDLASRDRPDVALLDFRLPGMDGMQVLRWFRQEQPDCSVVMISAHGTLELAVEAMKLGAADYLRKPFQAQEIELLVARLAQKEALARRAELYQRNEEHLDSEDQLVGSSAALRQVREMLAKVAAADASNILVEGESGTGKGLVARLIHRASRRGSEPFVEVSCTALTETLVESELFGHEKGAFTDARAAKKGMFELADGGTIFLDEIGDMPPGSQAKLLKALEDRSFRRVGGVRERAVDVLVVAATNRDLAEEVAAGRFRADLYYRLAVLRIHLPPLRERPGDVSELCEHFLRHFRRKLHCKVERLSPQALEALERHAWPGNVRELRNAIERAAILGSGQRIELADLPAEFTAQPPPPASPDGGGSGAPGLTLEQVERSMLEQALQACDGNQSRAARKLGLSRDTLRYRLKKYGIAADR